MRRAAITGTTALAIAGLVACASPQEPSGPRSITIAVDSLTSLTYFEAPVHSAATWDMGVQAVYESLIRWGSRSNKWLPYLAESVTVSEDRRTLTVGLREGVKFSDGTAMDAEGVKEVLDAVLFDEGLWTQPTSVASGLEIVVIDDLTLEFRADVAITTALPVDTGIVSPTAYLDPETRSRLVEHPVGTGPYLFEGAVPEVSATYVRNPDYWNPEAVDFERVTYERFDDPIAILNALKTRQVDAGKIPANYVAEAEAAGLSVFVPPATSSNMLLIVDTAGEIVPALGDVRVRQAMALAFDRTAIVDEVQNGIGNDSSQVFPEGHPGHVEDGDDRYAFDLDRARDLMAEAGYADGFDLVIPKPADPTAFGYAFELEPLILQALGDIGIRVTFEPTSDPYGMNGDNLNNAVLFLTLDLNAIYIYSSGQGADDWRRAFGDEGRELLETIVTGTQTASDEAWAAFGERALDQAWYIPLSQVAEGIWATQSDIELDTDEYIGFAPLDWFHIAE
jgi:peptide/nickel transport system substrate-binding protein